MTHDFLYPAVIGEVSEQSPMAARLLLAALLLCPGLGLLPPLGHDLSTALVVLGGCGDLARNKLFPGLLRLHQRSELPSSFIAVGCGREERSSEDFRGLLRERLPDDSAGFLSLVDYRQVHSYGSRLCLESLLGGLSRRCERILVYLALPPAVFADTLLGLADCSVSGLQLVLEKPIGRDAASCRSLLAALSRVSSSRPPLLVDHYLGKEVVRSIPGLRLGSPVIEQSLSRHHVRFVEGAPFPLTRSSL